MSGDEKRDALREDLHDQIIEISKVFEDLAGRLANQNARQTLFLGQQVGASRKPVTAAQIAAGVIAEIEKQRPGLSMLVRAAAAYDHYVDTTSEECS